MRVRPITRTEPDVETSKAGPIPTKAENTLQGFFDNRKDGETVVQAAIRRGEGEALIEATFAASKTNGSNGSTPPQPTTPKAEPTKGGKKPAADDKQFWAAVTEARQILARENAGWWRLGELADNVVAVYGEKKLDKFAKEIGIAACTVGRHRSVYRAWYREGTEAPGPESLPTSYAVARELQAQPDRFDQIEANPNMSKREARDIRLMREGKGRTQKEKGKTAAWLRNNIERQIKLIFQLVNKINRAVKIEATAETTGQELKEIYREVVGPSRALLPTGRDAGVGLIKFFEYLETVLDEDEDAEPEPDEEEPEEEEPAQSEAA
jgi:hypothetical protein